MYNLLLKDVRMAGIFLWIAVPGFLLYGAQFLAFGRGYYLSSIFITAFLSTGITAVDWKYETDRFVCSLPVERHRLVQERYLLAFGVTVCGYLLVTGYAGVFSHLFSIRDQVSELASWSGGITFILTVTLIFSIYYPCYFRWGLGRGFVTFSLIILALCCLVALVPALAEVWQVADPSFWSQPGGRLRQLLGFGRPTDDLRCRLAFAGLLLIAVLHGVSLSLALSVRSYRRRDF